MKFYSLYTLHIEPIFGINKTRRYKASTDDKNRMVTKPLNFYQIRALLKRSDAYICGPFIYRESNDKIIGKVEKKTLVRRVKIDYSLGRENKILCEA